MQADAAAGRSGEQRAEGLPSLRGALARQDPGELRGHLPEARGRAGGDPEVPRADQPPDQHQPRPGLADRGNGQEDGRVRLLPEGNVREEQVQGQLLPERDRHQGRGDQPPQATDGLEGRRDRQLERQAVGYG